MSDGLRGRRIVLIGGAGFIGHNLALDLKRQGADVHIIDSLFVNNLLWFISGNSEATQRKLYSKIINRRLELLHDADVPIHPQDAREYDALSRLLGQIKPDVIVHLAAVAHAGRSNKDPYSTFDHSLRTLENALDYARTRVEHFVFLSSSMAYGNFQTQQVDEEHPLNPMGIYGALKVAGEKMVVAYQQVFDLPYTIIRPSALYGPRCVSRRVMQIFIENAMTGGKLRVDGDGSDRLDFTCIDDLVQGIGLIIENERSRGEVFNLTYGKSRSIKELMEIVREHFPEVEVEHVERDKLMPHRGTLDVNKAKQLLGYSPENPIEVGIPKYIDFYRELLAEPATK